MLLAILIAGLAAGQNPLTVVSEPPSPLYSGARTFAACGRVEVEIEYFNRWAIGLQKLEVKAAFARKSRSLTGELSTVHGQSEYVDSVRFWCTGEDEISVAIITVSKKGGLLRSVLTVDERLEAKLNGPEPFDEERRP
jgi:hypothetical protein